MKYRVTNKQINRAAAEFLGVPFSWASTGSIYRYEDQGNKLYFLDLKYKNKWLLLDKKEKEQIERDLFGDWMLYLAEEVGGSDEISSDG